MQFYTDTLTVGFSGKTVVKVIVMVTIMVMIMVMFGYVMFMFTFMFVCLVIAHWLRVWSYGLRDGVG